MFITKKIIVFAATSITVSSTGALVSYLNKPNTPAFEKPLDNRIKDTQKSGLDFDFYIGEQGII